MFDQAEVSGGTIVDLLPIGWFLTNLNRGCFITRMGDVNIQSNFSDMFERARAILIKKQRSNLCFVTVQVDMMASSRI